MPKNSFDLGKQQFEALQATTKHPNTTKINNYNNNRARSRSSSSAATTSTTPAVTSSFYIQNKQKSICGSGGGVPSRLISANNNNNNNNNIATSASRSNSNNYEHPIEQPTITTTTTSTSLSESSNRMAAESSTTTTSYLNSSKRVLEVSSHRMSYEKAGRGLAEAKSELINSYNNTAKLSNYAEQKIFRDKCNIVFITFFLYGMSAFLPWNVIIAARSFFISYKLNTPISNGTFYQKNFFTILNMIWQSSFIVGNVANLFNCDKRCNQNIRIPFSLFAASLTTVGVLFLSIMDSRSWSNSMFFCMCLIVFVNAIFSGIIFSSAFYVSAILPFKYTNMTLFGFFLSSLAPCVITVVNKAVTINIGMTGVVFMIIAFGVLAVTFILHIALQFSPFYLFYLNRAKERQIICYRPLDAFIYMPYAKIIKKIFSYLFCIWLNIFTLMFVFSSYQQKIRPISSSFIIPRTWFTDITANVAFHFMIVLGTLMAFAIQKPHVKWSRWLVLLNSASAVAFFLLSNFEASQRKYIQVYIKNDYAYLAGCLYYPFSVGYLISLFAMHTPEQIDAKYKSLTAMLIAMVFSIGYVTGTQFSKLLESIALI